MIAFTEARVQAIAGRAARQWPASPTSAAADEPPDLAALYRASDGVELADGTRILRRDEIAAATAWLVGERALSWGPDLWVIGERDDVVIVRDLDTAGLRAGGGVVEAPTDGLSKLSRVATNLVAYLEQRSGLAPPSDEVAPERAARDAVTSGDADAIEHALARRFYPGGDRELAQAALALGGLRARAGDELRALEAFARSVEARMRAAPRGAEASEARAGWTACANAADRAGAVSLAVACRERGSSRIV